MTTREELILISNTFFDKGIEEAVNVAKGIEDAFNKIGKSRDFDLSAASDIREALKGDKIKIKCKRCGETFEDFADDYDKDYWMSNLCDDCLIEMGEEENDD